MRYAVINNSSNIIENVILWDGGTWSPPDNCYLIQTDIGNIGDTYDSGTGFFTRPV